MLSGERHEKILRELDLRGTLTVNDFAAKTGLSTMTIRGAEAAARALNARLILGVSNYSVEDEYRQLQRMVANSVDGILLATAGPLEAGSPTFDLLAGLAIPVVLVERSSRAFESVMSDHGYGGELAIEHLAAQGHRRIGLAIATSATAPWLRESYGRVGARLGLEADAPVMEYERLGPVGGNNLAEFAGFLEECKRTGTTAALVLPDEEAITLIHLAEESGMDVPEDFAIVVYDDEVADLAAVPLTSIAPPKRDVGHAAVTMCMERLAGKQGTTVSPALRRVNLAPKLIVRESSVTVGVSS